MAFAIERRDGSRERDPIQHSLFDALPPDIINSIAKEYLPPKALSQLSLASNESYQLVTSEGTYHTYTGSHSKLTYQSLKEENIIPIEILEKFQPRDYSLLNFNNPEDKDYFESVSNGLNHNLRKVNDDNFLVFYNRLSLNQKKYITSLTLPQNITNDELLQIFHECPNLEELICFECDQITGMGFDRLPYDLKLKKLIFYCPITDANLLSLMRKCPNLEELLCGGSDQITGVEFDELPNGLKLKKLYFHDCPITNANLLSLMRKCPNLEKLTCFGCDQITGVGFDRLPDDLKLKKLYFHSCPITDANLLSLMQKYPNLEELTCHWCGLITGEGFDELPDDLKLKKLYFYHCPIKDANLLSLMRKCPNLKELTCFKCDQITGVGFDRLPNDLKLKKLRFYNCSITNDNLLSLMRKCPNLEELLCGGSDQITGDGFDTLPPFLQLKKVTISYLPNLKKRCSLRFLRNNLNCLNIFSLDYVGFDGEQNILNFIRSEENKLWVKQVKTVASLLAISTLLGLGAYLSSKVL